MARPRREKGRAWLRAYPATHALVSLNLLVYVVMFALGPLRGLLHAHDWAGLFTASFSPEFLVRCGAVDSDLILAHGQWWRLVTSIFLHVSAVHLLLNVWCLWNLGFFGESLLGKRGLCCVYVLTGAAGMLASIGWTVLRMRGEQKLVAGASGAVFGLAGILIVLLSNRSLSLPWRELRSLRRLMIFFAVANLLAPQGMAMLPSAWLAWAHVAPASLKEIDNTAHLGGLGAGLLLGLPLYPRMTSGASSYRARQRMVFGAAALLMALAAYTVYRFWVEVPGRACCQLGFTLTRGHGTRTPGFRLRTGARPPEASREGGPSRCGRPPWQRTSAPWRGAGGGRYR